MYRCFQCRKLVDEPSIEREAVGEFHGHRAYESSAVCPYCGGHEFYEVERCPICGQYTSEEYCKDCVKYAVKAIGSAMFDKFREYTNTDEMLDLIEFVANHRLSNIKREIAKERRFSP